jgi:hypothetical protein
LEKDSFIGDAKSSRFALVLVTGLVLSLPANLCAEQPLFIRGDANMDSKVTLADVFKIIRFLTGVPLDCKSAADVDDDGAVDTVDVVFFMQAVLLRTHIPSPPFTSPGVDPTSDGLGCNQGLPAWGPGQGAAGEQGALGEPEDCDPPSGGGDLEFIHLLADETFVAYPGEKGIRIPIEYVSAGGIEGVTLSVYAPPELIQLDSIDFLTRVVSRLEPAPEWMALYNGKRDDGYLAASLALSIIPPVRTFPLLTGRAFAFLEFSIHENAPIGTTTTVEFRDTPGESNGLPPIQNEVSRQGNIQNLYSCGLRVHIVDRRDVFVRGDAIRDRQLDVTDAIAILSYAFMGSTLSCPDAADVNDDGTVDLTDAIALLSFIFSGGGQPAEPFPETGKDMTADDLPCEEG